jgi:ADP-heptose:LPS heptosyltransferase
MHGGGRHSNSLIRGLSARVAAGARTPDAVPLDRWIPYDLYQPNVLRAMEIASLVGADRAPLEPSLEVTESDFEASRQVVPVDGRPLVIVHPGASDSRRRWPAQNFAAVADALVEAGARVVLTGTAGEQPVVDAVKTAARYVLDDACEQLSMPALAGLLARAALVVSNDTGPRHLAAAVGTATVAIYWVGNVLTAGPLARRRHHVVMSWRLDCPVCGRNCIRGGCGHRESFVADVPMRTVRRRALDLLDSEVARGSATRDAATMRDRVPA